MKKKQSDAKNNGKLLNQAIIKYRIEKKDIVDSAYRSQFSQYTDGQRDQSQMDASQLSIGDGTRFTRDRELVEDDEEMEMDEDGLQTGKIRRGQVDFGEDAEEEDN